MENGQDEVIEVVNFISVLTYFDLNLVPGT